MFFFDFFLLFFSFLLFSLGTPLLFFFFSLLDSLQQYLKEWDCGILKA